MRQLWEVMRSIALMWWCWVFHHRHWGEVRTNFSGRTYRCRKCGERHLR